MGLEIPLHRVRTVRCVEVKVVYVSCRQRRFQQKPLKRIHLPPIEVIPLVISRSVRRRQGRGDLRSARWGSPPPWRGIGARTVRSAEGAARRCSKRADTLEESRSKIDTLWDLRDSGWRLPTLHWVVVGVSRRRGVWSVAVRAILSVCGGLGCPAGTRTLG